MVSYKEHLFALLIYFIEKFIYTLSTYVCASRNSENCKCHNLVTKQECICLSYAIYILSETFELAIGIASETYKKVPVMQSLYFLSTCDFVNTFVFGFPNQT